MKTVVAIVNGVELTERRLEVLNRWFEKPEYETDIENLVSMTNVMKDTFIKLMCDDANEEFRPEIIESMQIILLLQADLKQLIPERK